MVVLLSDEATYSGHYPQLVNSRLGRVVLAAVHHHLIGFLHPILSDQVDICFVLVVGIRWAE